RRRSDRPAGAGVLPGRRGPVPDGGNARRSRSGNRRRDRRLPPLPAQGQEPDGREPAFAPAHVPVPAPPINPPTRTPLPPGPPPSVGGASCPPPPAPAGNFRGPGGLSGEPRPGAAAAPVALPAPAMAEIVIEGEILPGVREPEGPFGEFTGYFSRRSTEHV